MKRRRRHAIPAPRQTAETAQARLLQAMGETLPITVAGMVAGLAFAFLLAIPSRLFPNAIRAFLPVAIVTQTVPLVALTPLLVLILGRGTTLTLRRRIHQRCALCWLGAHSGCAAPASMRSARG